MNPSGAKSLRILGRLAGTCILVLSLSAVGSASITFFDLGTVTPPSALGGVTLTPFPSDNNSLFGVVSAVVLPLGVVADSRALAQVEAEVATEAQLSLAVVQPGECGGSEWTT